MDKTHDEYLKRCFSDGCSGANGGTRTPDRLITNQTHYHCATLASVEAISPLDEGNGTHPREGWTTKTKSAKPLGGYGRGRCHAVPRHARASEVRERCHFQLAGPLSECRRCRRTRRQRNHRGVVRGRRQAGHQRRCGRCPCAAPPEEFAAYAPLKGLPSFLDLAVSLALGDHRSRLEDLGVHAGATATPGGSGALFLAAANFAERGEAVLLRDRHWGPYGGFLRGAGLNAATYPLLPSDEVDARHLDLDGFVTSLDRLVQSQRSVMTWLNDPAHNPTGLSLPAESRYALLNAFMESATRNEHVGHTLLLDAAYHLYADEPHGWAETIADALNDGLPWPENLLICVALSLSKSHTIYGLRTGALVYLHPELSSVRRLNDVMGLRVVKRGPLPQGLPSMC